MGGPARIGPRPCRQRIKLSEHRPDTRMSAVGRSPLLRLGPNGRIGSNMTLRSVLLAGANCVFNAAGWLEGGSSATLNVKVVFDTNVFVPALTLSVSCLPCIFQNMEMTRADQYRAHHTSTKRCLPGRAGRDVPRSQEEARRLAAPAAHRPGRRGQPGNVPAGSISDGCAAPGRSRCVRHRSHLGRSRGIRAGPPR